MPNIEGNTEEQEISIFQNLTFYIQPTVFGGRVDYISVVYILYPFFQIQKIWTHMKNVTDLEYSKSPVFFGLFLLQREILKT